MASYKEYLHRFENRNYRMAFQSWSIFSVSLIPSANSSLILVENKTKSWNSKVNTLKKKKKKRKEKGSMRKLLQTLKIWLTSGALSLVWMSNPQQTGIVGEKKIKLGFIVKTRGHSFWKADDHQMARTGNILREIEYKIKMPGPFIYLDRK